jgi:hypothetical protein
MRSSMRPSSRIRLALAASALLCAAAGLAGSARAGNGPGPGLGPVAQIVSSCQGVADGALCTDRNSCTVGDVCFHGACMGATVVDGTPCTDENQCTQNDLCHAGVCVGQRLADGTPCTDEDVCTDPDTCQGGACVSGPALQCDDGDPCTQDTCVMDDGCHYDMIPLCTDAGVDAMPDDANPPDATPPDAGPPDAPVDLPDTGGEDAIDDGSVDLPRLYEARGGACVCSSPAAPRSGTALGVLLAAVALSWRRKRGR